MPFSTNSYRYVLVAAALLLLLVFYFRSKIFFKRLPNKIPDKAATWRAYMRGQGTLLSLALVAGILLSWGSWAIARYLPGSSTIAAGGNLTEFRSLDPSEHPVYEQVAAKAFRHITILTKTAAPEGSSATITVFDDQDGDRKSQIQQLSSASATWTRWDHQNANRDISLVVESSATSGAPKATNVEVLIYLSPE